MKPLKEFVNEALLQPDDIGMATDGFFRLVKYGSDVSLIKSANDREERKKKRMSDIDKFIETQS